MTDKSLYALLILQTPYSETFVDSIWRNQRELLTSLVKGVKYDPESTKKKSSTPGPDIFPVKIITKFATTTEEFSNAVYTAAEKPHYIAYYTLGNDPVYHEPVFPYMDASGETSDLTVLVNPATLEEMVGSPHEGSELNALSEDNPFLLAAQATVEKESFKLLKPTNLRLVKTKSELDELVTRCQTERFAADTETNFLNPFLRSITPQILCYSIAFMTEPNSGWCIPTNPKHIEELGCDFDIDYANESINKVFFESEQPKTFHNAQYDCVALFECFGKRVKNVTTDSMLLVFLYKHAAQSAGLMNSLHLVDLPAYKDPIKEYIKNNKGKRSSGFEDIPITMLWEYAAMDALAVARLITYLEKEMDSSLWDFYNNIPHRTLMASIDLTIDGWEINKDRFYYTKKLLEEKVSEIYDTIISILGTNIDKDTFNIGSPAQLADVLFNRNKLGLVSFNKTASGSPATNEKAMNDLLAFHPVIFRIIQFRKTGKLYNSYSTTFRNAVGPGSRHSKYACTGRWVLQAQYRMTNRTSRLSNSNLEGHNGTKKKGGNILTLPGSGSMVKHYFGPEPVTRSSNELFDMIMEKLAVVDPDKSNEVVSWFDYDVSKTFKPDPPKKEPKPRKSKKTAAKAPEPDSLATLDEVPF